MWRHFFQISLALGLPICVLVIARSLARVSGNWRR